VSTTYPYLGSPGLMQQLVGPSGGMSREPINAPSVVGNMAGGETVVAPLKTRDRFTLPFTSRPGSGFADLLAMFQDGVFGRGPFVYVDPSKSNVLGLDVASMGIVDGSHGWAASSGTLAVDGTQASPVLGSAVLKWTITTASSTIQPGTGGATADVTVAPVVLGPEPVTVSVWMKASAAGSFTLRAAGYTSAGALSTSSVSVAGLVTTAWQRVAWTGTAGAYGTDQFVLPQIVAPSASPPASLWIAGAQVEYASAVSSWQRGYRSPRVTVTGWPGWASDKWDGYASHTLVLSEAY
jgi:hypothetical protein